jgi:phosphonopyruvate decarboxylase
MLSADLFVDGLVARGIKRFSGVPCSYLNPLLDVVKHGKAASYIPASSEGEALAMMSGSWIGGFSGVVLCQNSGLGNMVNPLTSFNMTFHVPVLLIISIRGQKGMNDEPQHQLMGKIGCPLLDLMGISWQILPDNDDKIAPILDIVCNDIIMKQRPTALLVHKKTFASCSKLNCLSTLTNCAQTPLPSRHEIIQAAVKNIDLNSIIVATTGKTGRELYEVEDRPSNLYCVGSMGYANAIAHGIAQAVSHRVFILDGDGAVIMHLGNLSTIGALKPKNLVHIVLDNGAYDSTGGQETVSSTMDFIQIANGMGYRYIFRCSATSEFIDVLQNLPVSGPIFIYVKIRQGSIPELGRPSLCPNQVARRLRGFIEQNLQCENLTLK